MFWFNKKTAPKVDLEQQLAEANRKIALQESLLAQDSAEEPSSHIYANVYQSDIGWHYEIIQGDDVCVYQDYYPGAEGFRPMTEEEARQLSGAIVKEWRERVNGDNKQ